MLRFDYIITHEDSYRPSVAVDVDVSEDITDEMDRKFKEKLWSTQTYHGVLVTSKIMRVYEDLLQKDGPETYKSKEAPTREVLTTVAWGGESLERSELLHPLVRNWLDVLVVDWGKAIPPNLTEKLVSLAGAASGGRIGFQEEVEVFM
jgi:hypothetical protein